MTIQDYLEVTEAIAINNHTGCRIQGNTMDGDHGEEVLTIQFSRIPTQAELRAEVVAMIEETCVPAHLTDAIVRQVETCVTFIMRVA